MIKTIVGNNGVTVHNAATHWPYFSSNGTQLGVGNMRYNGNNQTIEVYDGLVWMALTGAHASIELEPATQSAIRWVHAKITEEHRLRELGDKHPAVADALAAVAKAEEQVRIVAALVDVE